MEALKKSNTQMQEDNSETVPTLGCPSSQDPQQGERMTAWEGML